MKKIMLLIAVLLVDFNTTEADVGDTGDSRQFCTACTPQMWEEVSPFLPRNPDGSFMRPLDNVAVLRTYRNLWMSAESAHTSCMNLWADERIKLLVERAKLKRDLQRARSRK